MISLERSQKRTNRCLPWFFDTVIPYRARLWAVKNVSKEPFGNLYHKFDSEKLDEKGVTVLKTTWQPKIIINGILKLIKVL